MSPTCPVNHPSQLVLPQRVVIQVDPNSAREVEVAMEYVKVNSLVFGGLGGVVAGLITGLFLASLFKKKW